MGYYVTIQEASFTIPASKLDEAYAALCALNVTHDVYKTGRSWSGGQLISKSFAWMDENYPETCEDAKAILEALGFFTETLESGDLAIIEYDSKVGQEGLFIEALFPFVAPDSYITWRGEDGAFWKQTLQGTQNGRVVFE